MRYIIIIAICLSFFYSCKKSNQAGTINYLSANHIVNITKDGPKIYYAGFGSLQCYDLDKGLIIWSKDISFFPKGFNEAFDGANPIIYDSIILIVDKNNFFHTFKLKNGKPIKGYNSLYEENKDMRAVEAHNLPDSNVLIIFEEAPLKTTLACVNKDLKITWDITKNINCARLRISNKYIVAQVEDDIIFIDIKSGKVIDTFKDKLKNLGDDFSISSDTLVTVNAYQKIQCYTIHDKNLIWAKQIEPQVWNPEIVDNKVFIYNRGESKIIILDLPTGRDLVTLPSIGTPFKPIKHKGEMILGYLGKRQIDLINAQNFSLKKTYNIELDYIFFNMLKAEDKLVVFNKFGTSDKIAIIDLE
jgi:hypothetical protein